MTIVRPASTPANVATSTTSATIFAANTGNVRGRIVWNDSAAILYIVFASTAASATNVSVPIAAGATYVFDQPVYNGQVTGVLASGTGTARTTEY